MQVPDRVMGKAELWPSTCHIVVINRTPIPGMATTGHVKPSHLMGGVEGFNVTSPNVDFKSLMLYGDRMNSLFHAMLVTPLPAISHDLM